MGRSRRVVAGVGVLSAVVVGLASAGSSPAAADSAEPAEPSVAELACAGASGYPASIPVSFTSCGYTKAGSRVSVEIGMSPAALPEGAGTIGIYVRDNGFSTFALSRATDQTGIAVYSAGSGEGSFELNSGRISGTSNAGDNPGARLTFAPAEGTNFCGADQQADFVSRSGNSYFFSTPYAYTP